jgi:hypothetical protein
MFAQHLLCIECLHMLLAPRKCKQCILAKCFVCEENLNEHDTAHSATRTVHAGGWRLLSAPYMQAKPYKPLQPLAVKIQSVKLDQKGHFLFELFALEGSTDLMACGFQLCGCNRLFLHSVLCAEPLPLFHHSRTWTLCLPDNTMHQNPNPHDPPRDPQSCPPGMLQPVMQHTWRSVCLHCSLLDALRLEQSLSRWTASLGVLGPEDGQNPLIFGNILLRLSAGNLLAAIASIALSLAAASIGHLHARPVTLQQRQSNVSKCAAPHSA